MDVVGSLYHRSLSLGIYLVTQFCSSLTLDHQSTSKDTQVDVCALFVAFGMLNNTVIRRVIAVQGFTARDKHL